MTQRFKKGLLIGFTQILSVSSAFAYNTINLSINANDYLHYRDKAEKYLFAETQFKLNNEPAITAHEMETRGQGSIGYNRKNFGLKLDRPIRLGRIKSEKLNLLSMAADAGYISTRLGLLTAELLKIGTPLPTEYAEVIINGKSNGLYTIVEKPKSAIKSPYVVRRGYKSRFFHEEAEISKILTEAQVQQIKDTADSIYQDISTKKDVLLFNSLQKKMDIQAYMRWMAMNSLYTNGDYPDEVFFYVDAEMYKKGLIYFRVTPWDFDDLFKPMHGVPLNATAAAKPENQNSILYSYEDRLDRSFAPVNTYMYAQFKATARQVIADILTEIKTDALLGQIYTDISEYLDNAAILQMGAKDSGRKGISYTKNEIRNLFVKRKKQIDERRALLLERVQ